MDVFLIKGFVFFFVFDGGFQNCFDDWVFTVCGQVFDEFIG